MSEPHEVEVKFLVDNVRLLEDALAGKGFRRKTPFTHELNTLYDLPDGKLRARGEILRIRQYGNLWKLTHKSKGTEARHKTRVERETSLGNGHEMDRILRLLGFSPVFIYEKFRSEWTDGGGEVVIDRTPIGDVAEIEGTPAWIDATAAKLGVNPKSYITKSYARLFEEWRQRTGSRSDNMTFAALQVTPPA